MNRWCLPIAYAVLMATLVIAWFAWIVCHARNQRDVVLALRLAGAVVTYNDGYTRETVTSTGQPDEPLERHLSFQPSQVSFAGRPTPASSLVPLGRLGTLQTLSVDLADTGMSDECFHYVASSRALTLRGTAVTDAGLSCLRSSRSLAYIDLSGTQITDASLVSLAQTPTLSELKLAHTQVTDSGVLAIAGGRRLRRLELDRTRITDAVMAALGRCPLELLTVEDTEITDDGIAALCAQHSGQQGASKEGADEAEAPLSLAARRLRVLSLSGTRITDRIACCLKRFPSLRFLSLDRTDVSDASLTPLQNMIHLTELGVGETKITAAGISKLRKELPECIIRTYVAPIGDAWAHR